MTKLGFIVALHLICRYDFAFQSDQGDFMLKKLATLSLVFLAVNACAIEPDQVEKALKTIEKLPEARKLMAEIQQEGPIHFSISPEGPSQAFGACWDVDRRIIFINPRWHETFGRLIGSILFELQNARISSEFDKLDHLAASGKIDKGSYVRAVEKIEYDNSINAAEMAKKGVSSGLFPVSSLLPTYPSFEQHLEVQIRAGHSAEIARNFDIVRRHTRF
jgi:hypothetical protein